MLPSAGWRRCCCCWCCSGCCCSLLRMMLIMSPSWSFMCSIRRSLLVDSKPQMQQQKRRTQYSIPGPGPGVWIGPALGWPWCWDWRLGGWAWVRSFSGGLGASLGHCGGSVVGRGTELSAVDVGAGAGSSRALVLSVGGWAPPGRSATGSNTPDSLWGLLEVLIGRREGGRERENVRKGERVICKWEVTR